LGDALGIADWARDTVAYLSLYHVRRAPLFGTNPWVETLTEPPATFAVAPIRETRLSSVGSVVWRIRCRLLSAILRLADALDVDTQRAGGSRDHQVVQSTLRYEIE